MWERNITPVFQHHNNDMSMNIQRQVVWETLKSVSFHCYVSIDSASMEMTKRFRDLVNVLKEKLVGRLQVNSVL
jgi:hypothetical protein